MNRLLLIVSLLVILVMPQAYGLTTQSYPNPYRQTMWNNLTDGMHTLGQSPQQAKLTKSKLHYQRSKNRMKSINHANLAKFRAQRQAWQNSQNNQP